MRKIKLDYERLRQRCMSPETDFFDEGEVVTVGEGAQESFYIYKDNGAKILAVAHLDSVLMPNVNWTFQSAKLGNNGAKKTYIWNAQLDDRLGAYIILDLLPSILGENQYDVLLTTDEEIGHTTAEQFVLPEGKEYNWIFEFDRRGTGAVLYDYDDSDWRPVVAEHFSVQQGSFSDISRLQHLGVKAVNVGTGYHDEHQASCYMLVQETLFQVRDFLKFFAENKNTKFPHTIREHVYKSYGYSPSQASGGYFSNGVWTPYDDAEDWYDWRGTGASKTRTSNSNVTSTMASSTDPKAWVTLPNVVEFMVEFAESNEPITMYIHPMTGNQAVMCDVCGEMETLEDVLWLEDGHPVCPSCVHHHLSIREADSTSAIMPKIKSISDDSEVIHTEDKMIWVAEGGRIRKNGLNWIRILPQRRKDTIASKTVLCRRCSEPEWEEEAFLESGDSQSPVYYCRWCHEKVDQAEDEEDTREMRVQTMLPPSQPLSLPAPRLGIDVRSLLSPAMDDDDKDFYGNTRPESTPVSPFNIDPDDGSVG